MFVKPELNNQISTHKSHQITVGCIINWAYLSNINLAIVNKSDKIL